MRGHIRQRSAGSFELKVDIGKDAAGKRIVEYRTFRGGKRAAQGELAKLIAAVDKGEHVARSTLTVGAHVAERIEQWIALGKITPKTAERYRELLSNQIMPFIGAISLQTLKAIDVEKWHATLRVSGRRDGKGGLSALTIRARPPTAREGAQGGPALRSRGQKRGEHAAGAAGAARRSHDPERRSDARRGEQAQGSHYLLKGDRRALYRHAARRDPRAPLAGHRS